MEYCESSGDEYSLSGDDDRHFLGELHPSDASSCKVIRRESLLAAQKEDLQKVMDMLSLKEHHARTILIHYRWNVEKVFMVFVEKGNNKLYAEAGVTVEQQVDLSLSQCSSEVVCDICIENVSATDTTTMECGHCYCNDCWSEYFMVKINEGQSRRVRCMADKCNGICDEARIKGLVSIRDPELAEKFDRFLLESYIDDNKMVKWCPSIPHCGNAIRVEDDQYCEVECVCGLQFCFNCSSEAHSPCSCLMWELWGKKCSDESETVNWITVNTKPCPHCHKPVEKNGGCNRVQCICGQAFCWLCGCVYTWDAIQGHSCGRYKDNYYAINTEQARTELVRYIHYHNRYKAHIDSLKAEVELKQIILDKLSRIEARESASMNFSWVTNGLYRLFRSRRILSYSYPFAYYMFGELLKNEMTKNDKEIKQNLFEDQQEQLELIVEHLSMCLELPFDEYTKDIFLETKVKTIDLSEIADKCCKKLYECIDNDLLGELQQAIHIIAPYRSKGVERASEIPKKVSDTNGRCAARHYQPPCISQSSYDGRGISLKRARIGRQVQGIGSSGGSSPS